MIRDFYAAHKGAAAFAAATTAVALSVGYVLLPGLAPIVTLVIGWCVSVFVVAAGHWEAVEKHGGRALGLLAFASKSAERVGLSAEMQGIINSGRKDLSEEFAEIMPHPARLMFVRDAAELATLRDGEIVIALRDPSKHVENTARATLAYVAADTIRPARTYIDPLVMAGVHFSLTKRILRGSDSAALDYLINDLWDPTVRATSSVTQQAAGEAEHD